MLSACLPGREAKQAEQFSDFEGERQETTLDIYVVNE